MLPRSLRSTDSCLSSLNIRCGAFVVYLAANWTCLEYKLVLWGLSGYIGITATVVGDLWCPSTAEIDFVCLNHVTNVVHCKGKWHQAGRLVLHDGCGFTFNKVFMHFYIKTSLKTWAEQMYRCLLQL